MILDGLIGSFRSQLLALDDRLGEIQLGMLRGASPEVRDELVQILGVITDGIQELGWYSHDLEEIAETVDQLPGMGRGAQQHFDRHRRRVTRITASGKDTRGEAKDALSRYSEIVAGRQAQVINALTIVATVFLPLSFLTGYFGMNFSALTRLGHALAAETLDTYSHLWPDSEDRTRIAVDSVLGPESAADSMGQGTSGEVESAGQGLCDGRVGLYAGFCGRGASRHCPGRRPSI